MSAIVEQQGPPASSVPFRRRLRPVAFARELWRAGPLILTLAERELPTGLLTGLYLHGGVIFGEWAPRESDVDFLATLSRRPEPAEVEVLRGVHAQMAAYSPIRFDGPHVLASDLARDRYNSGLASYIEILTADQDLFQQKLLLAQTRGAELRARAELYRSLGGGWQP